MNMKPNEKVACRIWLTITRCFTFTTSNAVKSLQTFLLIVTKVKDNQLTSSYKKQFINLLRSLKLVLRVSTRQNCLRWMCASLCLFLSSAHLDGLSNSWLFSKNRFGNFLGQLYQSTDTSSICWQQPKEAKQTRNRRSLLFKPWLYSAW